MLKVPAAKNVWFFIIGFFNHEVKFQDSVCNGCYDLRILSANIRDIPIITDKNVDYCCIIHKISKSEANSLLENCAPQDRGHI